MSSNKGGVFDTYHEALDHEQSCWTSSSAFPPMSKAAPKRTTSQELFEFCQSDSLSVDGVRAIIERHGAPNNWTIFNYAFFHQTCRNERVTLEIILCLLGYFPDAVRHADAAGLLPLNIIRHNKNATLEMLHLLIDAFPDSLRHKDNNGDTLLHCLCISDFMDEEMAKKFIKMIVERFPESVRHTGNNGSLPIHCAAARQSPDFCRILIDAHPGSERMANNDGTLPFHCACGDNTVATAKYLYQLYPESINVANNYGCHSIHYVIVGLENKSNPKDGIEVLKFLLDCNALSSTEETPIHVVCSLENVTLNTVQLLIDAFPDSLRHEDNKGLMPLHSLCANDILNEEVKVEILKLLVERCSESVRHTDNDGSLPIHFAAAYQSPEFCRILIEAYPGSERITVGRAYLPFHYACQFNAVATAKFLYQLYPGSINVTDSEGYFPIHIAVLSLKERRKNNPEAATEIVQFLLDCSPDVVLQKHRNLGGERLPFGVACSIYSVFYNHGWNAIDGDPAVDAALLKILQILYDAYPEAIEAEKFEVRVSLDKHCEEIRTFINGQLDYVRLSKDLRQMNTPHHKDGQLPLHKALQENTCLGSIKLLVKGNSTALRCIDNTGMLPLHIACQFHVSVSVIEYLIGIYSFALETKDRCQNTVLHCACRGANRAIIALLVEKYGAAYLLARNSQGQLPIDLLFESEAVGGRSGIEYTDCVYRLVRAQPDTVMNLLL